MNPYKSDKDEFYESRHNVELKPKTEDDFAFEISKMRQKKEIDLYYKAINNAIICVYIFEAIFIVFVPGWVLRWFVQFSNIHPPGFMWAILVFLFCVSAWLFNKYGFIKTLNRINQIYGRAYFYKNIEEKWTSFVEYNKKLAEEKRKGINNKD